MDSRLKFLRFERFVIRCGDAWRERGSQMDVIARIETREVGKSAFHMGRGAGSRKRTSNGEPKMTRYSWRAEKSR